MAASFIWPNRRVLMLKQSKWIHFAASLSENSLGLKVIHDNDPVDGLKYLGKYDVVTLWHVIEHLPDPWKVLEAISIKLNPGGFLVLAAPNPDSFQFFLLRRYWPHVDAPRHLSLISLPLLTKQLLSLGFKPVLSTTKDQGTLGWNTFGWIYFFANFTNSPYIKSRLGIFGNIVSIIMGPLERINGFGSAYTVVFQKDKR